MKIRSDFVTNSSSSSFIVIPKMSPATEFKKGKDTISVYDIGCMGGHKCFDRCYQESFDVHSKINFLALYIDSLEGFDGNTEIVAEYKQKLEEAIKVFFGAEKVNWNRPDGWIDHAGEQESDVKFIFSSKEMLWKYLFDDRSGIVMYDDESFDKEEEYLQDVSPKGCDIENIPSVDYIKNKGW